MYEFHNKQYNCTLEITSDLIGGRWKPAILWLLSKKTRRFGELKKMITGITQKMLTQQLRELEESGLINRKVYAEVPPKVEYSLTDDGYSLVPILTMMCEWGHSYIKKYNNVEVEKCSVGAK